MKTQILGVVLLFLGAAASSAFADVDGDWGGMMYGGGWGHMISGAFMMVLFWGGLILLSVLGLRWFSDHRNQEHGRQTGSSLEILKERFARGEIDSAEYEERRRILTS